MTPPPNRADCSSAKEYVQQAQVWARKHGVNRPLVNERLKRPQEPASTPSAGPSLAARPSPTTGLKPPSADSTDRSSKRPCPAGPQPLGLAACFSALPHDPTPIILSPEPAFPQAPATPAKDTEMGPNDPSHTPSGSPPSFPPSAPHTETLQARAARASSIHTLDSTNPPSPQANTTPMAPRLLAPLAATVRATSRDSPTPRPRASSVPIHLPPPAEPAADTEAGLLNCQLAEISRDLRNTFPNNPLWEQAVFPAAAVLDFVGAFRNMYRALLHISTITPAQHRRRYAFFLVGINQLVEQLELAIVVPADKRTL
ncbi:hypothetical protein PTTG_08706 [Puccinia triticina 1-1 BBBD Race 1]|uniref:Uncharacterized protein n=1 Tax=Puccinia triticina (isolate 1-1 / race 1 (BBBD)) TaxID=630390 RepID=A0A180GVG9_PUCT1|nr:hypothetical protein PTTG_08706 [Puccinia triticina 1-1 BBBD Race 1]